MNIKNINYVLIKFIEIVKKIYYKVNMIICCLIIKKNPKNFVFNLKQLQVLRKLGGKIVDLSVQYL